MEIHPKAILLSAAEQPRHLYNMKSIKFKMQRKAIGSIVATVILVLVAVVGTAIFIGAYLKSVDKNTSSDSSSCFGIELKLDNCAIITPQMVNLSLPLNLQITGPA